MLDNLEFHYVVSCKNGEWNVVEEDPYFPDGTTYDWDAHEWIMISDNEEAESLDLDQYRVLRSALSQLTHGEINA